MMIRFNDGNDFIEIRLMEEAETDIPSKGDGVFHVSVRSADYSGQTKDWVEADVLRLFCSDLIALGAKRTGEASLVGMSPDGMRVRVFAIDKLGHMAVEGKIGHRVYREHRAFFHSASFGFEFDPSQLMQAAGTDWVMRNAAKA
jgi:hypothetical protein